jgi:hypothetical protein
MRKSAVILVIFLGVGVPCEPVFAEVESSDALLKKVCSQCHSLNQTLAKPKTKIRWKKAVARCRYKLAVKNADTSEPYLTINDKEAEQLATYLYSKWGYKSEKADTVVEKKREKLLEQFTPTKARSEADTEKRKELLKGFTPTKVDLETEAERKKRLQKKFTSSATIEDRRKKLLKKFAPSKARIEDSGVKRKKLLEKLSVSEASTSKAEARRKELKEKFSPSDASASAAEDRRKKFREKFRPQKARTVSPTSRTAKEKTE